MKGIYWHLVYQQKKLTKSSKECTNLMGSSVAWPWSIILMLVCIYLILISSAAINSEGVVSSTLYILSELSPLCCLFSDLDIVTSLKNSTWEFFLIHSSYVHVWYRERFPYSITQKLATHSLQISAIYFIFCRCNLFIGRPKSAIFP